MPHFVDTIINQYGRPVPNVSVTVYFPSGSTTPALIYSDNLVTLMTNPFQADGLGNVSFWVAAGGDYDLALSGGSPAINPATVTVTVAGAGGGGSGIAAYKVVTTGSIAAGQAASVTVTWDVPFPDASYKFTTSVLESVSPGTGGLRILQVESITAAAIVVRVVNDDPTSAHTGTIYALAF